MSKYSISRDQDSSGNRYYTDGQNKALSVTTILKHLDEDMTGLENWKDKNDGRGDNADHNHLFWYSGPRGTLCHYYALSNFEDKFDQGTMWGSEEASSIAKISNGPAKDSFYRASTNNTDIVYSLLKDRGMVDSREGFFEADLDALTINELKDNDVNYFTDVFEQMCEDMNVNDDTVVAVEQYLLEPTVRFGGQVDMVYYDEIEEEYVVVDLKTSSSVRHKHRLQSVAYAKAIENTNRLPNVDKVGRVEVWRISPTKENYEILTNRVPEHAEEYSYVKDSSWNSDYWGDFQYRSLEHMWDTFKSLAARVYREKEFAEREARQNQTVTVPTIALDN